MNSFNAADVVVLIVIGVCVYYHYKRGLVSTLLGFCSLFFSAVLSRFLSPFIGDLLRKTPLYDSIKSYVITSVIPQGEKIGTDFIRQLTIPDFLKDALVDNNNSIVYQKLNVSGTEDYISGYIAGFIINIIAMVILFILLLILFKFLARTLNIIARMPVLRTANKLGGAALGFIQGVIIIWVGLAVLTIFYGKPMFEGVNEAILNSVIASKFYDSNILITGLSTIGNLV